ncbi:MAG: hypothetical protein ACREHG_00310 [Candidatus Saccharimonadales bacterium]
MSSTTALIILVVEFIGMILIMRENKSMRYVNKRKTYTDDGHAYQNAIQRQGICTMVKVQEVYQVEEGYPTGYNSQERKMLGMGENMNKDGFS